MENQVIALNEDELEAISAGLTVNQAVGYTLIGATAIGVGATAGLLGVPLVIGGTFLLGMEALAA